MNKLIRSMALYRLNEADTGTGTQGATTETGENNSGNEAPKSFDDILKDKSYQSEFDRRISKAIETAKGKWAAESQAQIEAAKTEAEKLAKMNAEQKAKYEADKRLADLERREKEITIRELKAQAHATLAENSLPKELAEILDYSNAENCNKSIEAVKAAFQSAVQSEVNKTLRGKSTPKDGAGTKTNNGFSFNFTGVRSHK